MDFLFPLLKNSKFGVDDRGHRLRITHTRRPPPPPPQLQEGTGGVKIKLCSSACQKAVIRFDFRLFWLF